MFRFSSKAETLEYLYSLIQNGKVLPVYKFLVKEFFLEKDEVIDRINSYFRGEELLVIRSSAKNEDSACFSNAGHYRSVMGIPVGEKQLLAEAIGQVIASYDEPHDDHLVFVQPQLMNIRMAGVAMTADLDTLAPYYIINFDRSGSTDSITSGRGNHYTYVLYKHAPESCINDEFKILVRVLKEIEAVCGYPHLDIEFAIDSNDEVHIFQVRPIVASGKENLSALNLHNALFRIHSKITKLSKPHPNLLGQNAVYGVMPDWNPAEIIGFKPKTLAATLYKEIITDNIWAYQRDNYGYRNLRSHPLKLLFLGIPYIDVRVDFNSFVPKDLDEKIAQKLVDQYLDKLIENPVLHDKVEFEIVHSCYYFNLPEKLASEYGGIFSPEEISEIGKSLLRLTNQIIRPGSGLFNGDQKKIEQLEDKYDTIVSSGLSHIDKIYWLIEDCKRFGTLPFAGIARAAFIATQILGSLVELGIISVEERAHFLNSLNTITKQMSRDVTKYAKGEMTKDEFLAVYGHLRPGTYDILSPRYDADFEKYFAHFETSSSETRDFKFSDAQLGMIGMLVEKAGLETSAEELVLFIRQSIEWREYAKLVFTRSVSKSLEYIRELAEKYNVKKDDLAYLDIRTVLGLYSSLDYRGIKEIFEADIFKNRQSYEYTKAVKLPALITSPDDVYAHFLVSEDPNYITLNSITAPIALEDSIRDEDISGKIVFIRSADPGYDFLFTKRIAGLVTLFGGANSHMSVRCAELGIPAVIGAGEKNFSLWSQAKVLAVDCLNKRIEIIS